MPTRLAKAAVQRRERRHPASRCPWCGRRRGRRTGARGCSTRRTPRRPQRRSSGTSSPLVDGDAQSNAPPTSRCARVMPARMPADSGGVATRPALTTKTLDEAPSTTSPRASTRRASCAPRSVSLAHGEQVRAGSSRAWRPRRRCPSRGARRRHGDGGDAAGVRVASRRRHRLDEQNAQRVCRLRRIEPERTAAARQDDAHVVLACRRRPASGRGRSRRGASASDGRDVDEDALGRAAKARQVLVQREGTTAVGRAAPRRPRRRRGSRGRTR